MSDWLTDPKVWGAFFIAIAGIVSNGYQHNANESDKAIRGESCQESMIKLVKFYEEKRK